MFNIDTEDQLPTPSEAREILWRNSDLTFKLDENQIQLRNSHHKGRRSVWAASRRIGKSHTLLVIAIEKCLSKKNAEVKYLADTQKNVKDIIRPLMQDLCADAPDDIRPVEKRQEGYWFFPSTGSRIKIVGCDGGRANSARGGNSDLCIIDEAGFVDDLENIIKNILNPTMILTKGKMILASTPPMSATHDFVMFMNQAKIDGSFVRKTIYDNPRLTAEDIERIAEEDCGGKNTNSFRREYLAEVITDDNSAIVPEFTKELQAEIIREWKRPAFAHNYVAMDVGARDLTVVLFGYHDFRAGKLIIEDEYVVTGKEFNTDVLAKNIRMKEHKVFADPFTGEVMGPYKRVSDNNLLLINDLYQLHELNFIPTRKDDADAALNNLRILIASKQIIINPRCKTLILHLEAGVWDKSKSKFARSSLKFGHFDAIDSLKYMVRNVEFQENPYPAGYGMPSRNTQFFTGNSSPKTQYSEAALKIMNIKTKR